MSERIAGSTTDAVITAVGNAEGMIIVDIGCGTGGLCRALHAVGGRITGIEPNVEALAKARNEGEGPRYLHGTTEELNLPAQSFDLVVFCTSLHHIPNKNSALQDARQLLKPKGRIIIVEPEADDPLDPVICWIDDERAVYLEAQKAIDNLVEAGICIRSQPAFYTSRYRVNSPETLIEDMLQVDGSREIGATARKNVAAAFEAAVKQDAEGSYIEHWYRLDQLHMV